MKKPTLILTELEIMYLLHGRTFFSDHDSHARIKAISLEFVLHGKGLKDKHGNLTDKGRAVVCLIRIFRDEYRRGLLAKAYGA